MGFTKKRKRTKKRQLRPKTCRFCEEGIFYVDYKDDEQLLRYLTEKGKVLPRRITGTCNLHQKMLSSAIKRARCLALIK